MKNQTEIGTIAWAIEHAKRGQKRAIDRINKNKTGIKNMRGLKKQTKFYMELLALNENANCFKRGYMLLTDIEYQYAVGLIPSLKKIEFGKGKKMIIGIDVTIYGKLTLVPIR